MGCSSVGRASDRHATDAGSTPHYGKGFFSQSPFSADSLTVSVHSSVQSHAFIFVRTSLSPCQSSVDYGNTKTPSMHRRLGGVTLSQLAFLGKKEPEFAMLEIPMGQYSCLKKEEEKTMA